MAKVNINWSSYVRDAIDKKLREHRMERAGRHMDKIRKKTAGRGVDMTSEVLAWRRKH